MHQRLFEITLLLTQRGDATADELAGRFGVSRRTIYRDIDALSRAGIPVYSQPGKGGGIRMLPGFTIDRTLFTREEQAQLVAHVGSLASLGAPDTEALLDKLAAVFGRADSWLEVDFAPWGGGEEARALFRLLRDGILQRRPVAFTYVGAQRQASRRTVEPARVIFRGQGWYLQAFCRQRAGWRFFKLNRMADATLLDETFTPRPLPPAHEPYTGDAQRVRLRFAPSAAFRVVDEFAPGQITHLPGGGFEVEARLPTGGGWLPGYLLSHGPAAEVLEPAWLREEMKDILEDMVARYREE